jgi:hypothetical protein
MTSEGDVSRRAFLAGLAALAATARTSVGAGATADVPVVARRVEKLYKIAGCTQPNDLQFVADGLWVLDQVDPNKAFKVRPEDGSVIKEDPETRGSPQAECEDGRPYRDADVLVALCGIGHRTRLPDPIRGELPQRRPVRCVRSDEGAPPVAIEEQSACGDHQTTSENSASDVLDLPDGLPGLNVERLECLARLS